MRPGVRGASSGHPTKWVVAAVAAVVAAGVLAGPASVMGVAAQESDAGATPEAVSITVYLDESVGPANTELAGIGWNTGDLELLGDYRPPTVRIDSRLERVGEVEGVLELDGVFARAEAVHAIGAEPLLILYAAPSRLGEQAAIDCVVTIFISCDPGLLRPDDLDAWEDFVTDVVRALATAPEESRVTRFEVWNEPDAFPFWHDTAEAFFETALRTHRAVATLEAETGIDLEVGGPAGFPPPSLIHDYVAAVRDEGLPLDFVSWHWYANAPNLGPDGNEGFVDDALYELLAGQNPALTPAMYGDQTVAGRATLDEQLAGTDYDPLLVIDEWNISPGGLDLRHDDHRGAAFVAGSLIEMEESGLDRANLYRAIESDPDDRSTDGDWGVVGRDGVPDPQWVILRDWAATQGELLEVDGVDRDAGLWARGVRTLDGEISVIVVSFTAAGAPPRQVTVSLVGEDAPRSMAGSVIGASGEVAVEESLDQAGSIELELGGDAVATLSSPVEGEDPATDGGGDEVIGVAASPDESNAALWVGVAIALALLGGAVVVTVVRGRSGTQGSD